MDYLQAGDVEGLLSLYEASSDGSAASWPGDVCGPRASPRHGHVASDLIVVDTSRRPARVVLLPLTPEP
ncbi:hypothetical protein [Actinacidiphila soli]|uniref:hypothetical protein n=1 Tax=Actinacidiphila soli TaxID=2487275 RepID=UPI001F0CB96E|nr:hypothetical protein [Actinacidiphila soli]